jgi:hypothetical protein
LLVGWLTQARDGAKARRRTSDLVHRRDAHRDLRQGAVAGRDNPFNRNGRHEPDDEVDACAFLACDQPEMLGLG